MLVAATRTVGRATEVERKTDTSLHNDICLRSKISAWQLSNVHVVVSWAMICRAGVYCGVFGHSDWDLFHESAAHKRSTSSFVTPAQAIRALT